MLQQASTVSDLFNNDNDNGSSNDSDNKTLSASLYCLYDRCTEFQEGGYGRLGNVVVFNDDELVRVRVRNGVYFRGS